MRNLVSAGVLFLGLVANAPAKACMVDAEVVLDDVKYADTVVVGRIANYKVVTPKGRERGYIWDYARFDVLVDETLKGHPGRTLTVTWDNSTFGEPDEIPAGRYLIAVRNPGSNVIPPLRAPSATVFARPEPESPTLLQAPCASPFMFEITSKEAIAVRRILQGSAP